MGTVRPGEIEARSSGDREDVVVPIVSVSQLGEIEARSSGDRERSIADRREFAPADPGAEHGRGDVAVATGARRRYTVAPTRVESV